MIDKPQCNNVGSNRNESLQMQPLRAFFGNPERLKAGRYVDPGIKIENWTPKLLGANLLGFSQ
jgi:hypothetical protein